MGAIPDLNEAWAGHSGLEVETFLKQQIASALSLAGAKYGYVEMAGSDLRFYDEEGGTMLASISIGGDVYSIDIHSNLDRIFYVLADETSKILTISADTNVSPFGSTQGEPYPEGYSYVISVNTGGGYIPRANGVIPVGEEASVDIRPYLATGDNFVRIAMTGLSSGQAKTVVLTGTLTSLTMSVDHAWENVWTQENDYVITGIRFAGSIAKTLHVAVDGVEQTPVSYSPNQSYTTTATTYTIPASAFPAIGGNGVHTVTLWMTAGSVSTPVKTYYIMCAANNDTTPMVAINDITPMAVNYTSGRLMGYAVYRANKVSFVLNATLGGITYPIALGVEVTEREEGHKYELSYAIEIDTGANATVLGTMTAQATPYAGSTAGTAHSVTTGFDNTYSYIATPGALFYLNASTRDNGASNYDKIVNEMGASRDGNFAAQYNAVWSGMSWNGDGWATDPQGHRALVIPAGGSVSVTDFAPLGLLASYPNGFTVEMMLQCGSPSEYDTPVFQMFSSNNGIKIFPTKILVLGTSERSEVLQSVNLAENRMTHIVVTFTKNYEGVANRNLISVYVNGISNVNFAFDGSSSFGAGELTIGQQDADAYLYKMRVYGTALDSRSVFNNFLNSIVDGVEFDRRQQYIANDILDGGVVDYEACKAAGFNTMVIIMDDDSHQIPSFDNQASYDGCTLRFEYADESANSVEVRNVSIDGQGTTSKKYFRWNLRAKTSSSTVWNYGNGTSETGKEGYFAGPSRVRVDRITAKKNYASSMQGHKMGMTGLYNDLFKQLGLGAGLPDDDYMVAVYQYPFVGFKYNATNDSYEYIGLYTAGPDKGSKVTFGYASSYGSLLSIEGPNHAPRGTRFLHPWVDVTYDYQDETLKYGGEEGWDCDYVGGGLSSDKAADAASILALYESEWRPAYELVFNCSPYIASYQEVLAGLPGLSTLSDLLSEANVQTIFAGSTNGISNQLICFYDDNYELYFYRTSTEKFEKLQTVDSSREHNVVSYLYANGYLSTQAPTTAQIIAARSARFKAEAGRYWDVNQTLFHYCYCVLFGVTDNFAKNSYPFKFQPLSSSARGNRWGWREDDLDTVLATDNNGTNTKSYSVEHGDTSGDGVEIFQGGNSALWVLVRDNYGTEIRQMMISMANAAAQIATALGIQGDGLHNSMFNLVSYYCWEHSSKYFAATLYENDRRWSYLEPWLRDPSAVYNNVPPLTQSLGDQYQAEMLWVERRIAYIFSKYRIGAFTGDNMGYGAIAFTLAQPFTFFIVPAIDLYPVISLANTSDTQGGRTPAGQSATMTITADGQTTNYIHGGDWLASLGDICGMLLTSRGAGSDIAFSINNARIQTLKIGDATPGNVVFNATNLQVSSPALTLIDARNTTTIRNAVDLLNCPRLRKALFAGSGATGLLLPVGAKLNEVSFPSLASLVFMHSLPFLQLANLTLPAYSGIVSLYINNCANINPLELVKDILDTQNNALQYVTIIWRNVLQASLAQINALFELTNKAGYVDYQDGSVIIVNGTPDVEGALSSNQRMAASVYAAIEDSFPKIILAFDLSKVYIDFVDQYVEAIALTNWDTNSTGEITLDEARAVTTLGALFRNNTNIASFNELRFFEGLVNIGNKGDSSNGAFFGCTNLQHIQLPKTLVTIGGTMFKGCSKLTSITIPKATKIIGRSAFENCSLLTDVYGLEEVTELTEACFDNCTSLKSDINMPKLEILGTYSCFMNTAIKKILNLGSIATIGGTYGRGIFNGCASLEELHLPDTIRTLGITAFANCSSLKHIYGLEHVESLHTSVFNGCSSLEDDLNMPNLQEMLGPGNFKNCSLIKRIISLGSLTVLTSAHQNGCFESCTALEEVNLPLTMSELQTYSFYNCTSLRTINIGHLTVLRDNVFNGCMAINYDINLPNLVELGSAFSNSGITKVSNLGMIQSIVNYGFQYCRSLVSVELPSSITSIGVRAFFENSALETVTVNSVSVPSVDGSSFLNTNKLATIYVVPSLIASYYKATNWTSIASKVFPKGISDLSKSIVKGVSLDTNGNAVVNADYSVTFNIPVLNGHSISVYGGFVDSGKYVVELNQYNNKTASNSQNANPKTFTVNSNTKNLRMTVKNSDLANAYVLDNSTNTYLWKGREVTTIYE